ncbi:hypothetical protein [Nonomuraea glycinis]|uniref:hypothetical protein n=1 Tax=Nonomuraea glycinis TaxID=2047744 RepID=UPI002E0FB675|nr:hypothetical protein OHA68_09310 [Nonomuraea glycinis]
METGRSIVDVEAIGAEMLEDRHGWPIARVHADQMVGYIHQAMDGGILVELFTRDEDAADRLRVLVDGQPLHPGAPAKPLPAPPQH